MTGALRVFSIAPGVPFLPTLAEKLLSGALVPGFAFDGDPLRLADATIYVPTRRAARELRSAFVELMGGRSAILPVVRPLGEFEDDAALFEADGGDALALAPPVPALDRLLLLAPLVHAWKRRLPAHLAARFGEDVVVPASAADAIWLARDLAALLDEMETEGADWTKLAGLVEADLAAWWQVTLDFLAIATVYWPAELAERDRSNPAAHRNALIRAEAARLKRNPPAGPVIAAGSTGSIPATAELLSTIARLDGGAVVLPGLDFGMDGPSWTALGLADRSPSVFGHPQFGLRKLLDTMRIDRADVVELGTPSPDMAERNRLVSEALRPAGTTDAWAARDLSAGATDQALAGVALVEAANEREEATAIAVALRKAIAVPGSSAALVTPDRDLARRVAAELARFGIAADDSGGTPLARTPPAALLALMLQAVFRPGDPVAPLSLLKHPLLSLGLPRATVRQAAEAVDLVALRGGTGRPDIAELFEQFEARLAALDAAERKPFWLGRLDGPRRSEARALLSALHMALSPLAALRTGAAGLAEIAAASVTAFEALGRGEDGTLDALYGRDAGEALAGFLRALAGTAAELAFMPSEWPDIFDALIATQTVKPPPGADQRVAIWGALEARLQTVDTLVLGGLNEGSWPRRADADRFMSRLMKAGLALEPPERQIGLAAHDFQMAMGATRVILSRSARSGEAPALPSRWLQRLTTFVGAEQADGLRRRGAEVIGWARRLDESESVTAVERPNPKPPVAMRPFDFSVTEIETLRRDPYAIYARRVLRLQPVDPLLRDPGAAERGSLFHDIMDRFTRAGIDARRPQALAGLLEISRAAFAEAALPDDVRAVWWRRFELLAEGIVDWERERAGSLARSFAEARAGRIPVEALGSLSGRADRIDLLKGGGAEILDYKTGASPSKGQAHTLVSPQLALEGALMMRGAFAGIGPVEPSDLAFIRFRPNGEVVPESILTHRQSVKSASALSGEAWHRLGELLAHYRNPDSGYLSRALPFREGDMDGDYDHLARVLEWSAGPDAGDGEAA